MKLANFKKKHSFNTHPLQKVILGFLTVIFTGAVLLSLPVSSASGLWTEPIHALFTSTSATCVTGLASVITASYWSFFGQAVIISLVQIGGLGFMTMVILMTSLFKRRISVRDRISMAGTIGLDGAPDIKPIVKRIAAVTFILEGVGAFLFCFRFIPQFGIKEGIWKSIFLAISAFCNSGFDIMSDHSLVDYHGDLLVNLVLCALIIVGGIGFIVWEEIYHKRSYKKLSVYSKIVISFSGFLLISGMIFFFISENNNPDTIGRLSIGEKLVASFFHSTSMRTAGFYTFDNSMMNPPSKLISVLLMIIGGSPGSTAGGIKTVTFFVIIITLFHIARGDNIIKHRYKTFSSQDILRAFTLLFISLGIIFTGTFIISGFEPNVSFSSLIYECTSAFSTVGMTVMGTPELNHHTLVVFMFLMFFGRVGIMLLSITIMNRLGSCNDRITYPKADILIG